VEAEQRAVVMALKWTSRLQAMSRVQTLVLRPWIESWPQVAQGRCCAQEMATGPQSNEGALWHCAAPLLQRVVPVLVQVHDVEANTVLGGSGHRPAGTTNMESPPVVELQQPA